MKRAIVVAGSLNMDFVMTTSKLPVPGETVLGRSFEMLPGGKGANQACAAGRLARGTPVRMMGRVGYDVFADHLRASLAAANVDVSGVIGTKAQATGAAMIGVDAQGQNSIIVASGANFAFSPKDVASARPTFADAGYLLVQLETPLPTVAELLRTARSAGAVTILDPAPACYLPDEILREVDILTPNETEACLLAGEPVREVNASDAAPLLAKLRSLAPRAQIILKLGHHGCMSFANGEVQHHSPFAVQAVDSTAAGDTFAGALAVALSEGKSLHEALRFANAAAALSVTRLGAQASIPSRDEVELLLAQSPGVDASITS